MATFIFGPVATADGDGDADGEISVPAPGEGDASGPGDSDSVGETTTGPDAGVPLALAQERAKLMAIRPRDPGKG